MKMIYKEKIGISGIKTTKLQRNMYSPEQIGRQNLEYLTFPAFRECGVVEHLFSTRTGGASKDCYATMNLGFTRGDRREAVLENHRRIGELFGKGLNAFVCSDQTHTTNVLAVTKKDAGKGTIKKKDYSDIDGLITNEPGLILSCYFADCVPLYFVDPVKKAIGLSHAGWRGTVGKIGQKTIDKMKELYGTNPQDLLVAIGPSVCMDCYEVGEEVANQFKDAFIDEEILIDKENGKYQLDLWKANYDVFLEAGVKEEHISVTNLCTHCNSEYLFSHRMAGDKRGNLGAFLMLK